MKSFIKTIAMFLCVFILLTPDTALAGYLDPGSGSTLVQAIIASIAAIKNFWTKLINGVKNIFGFGK